MADEVQYNDQTVENNIVRPNRQVFDSSIHCCHPVLSTPSYWGCSIDRIVDQIVETDPGAVVRENVTDILPMKQIDPLQVYNMEETFFFKSENWNACVSSKNQAILLVSTLEPLNRQLWRRIQKNEWLEQYALACADAIPSNNIASAWRGE